jgi:hypothetical protein
MEFLRRFHWPNRQPDHPALAHLTQEQWNAHKSAWADRCYHVGRYKNMHTSLAGWLAAEGLPPTPPATLQAVEQEYAAHAAYIAALPQPLKIARSPQAIR